MFWGHDAKYPATVTDNGDGSIHLKSDSDFGSVVPARALFPRKKWIIKCEVENIVGNGKISYRNQAGVWFNNQFTTDGVHEFAFENTIKEIHIGADSDPTFECDFKFISLRENDTRHGQHRTHNNNRRGRSRRSDKLGNRENGDVSKYAGGRIS